MKVWLIKPSIDVRDGADVVKSRIGLSANAEIVTPDKNLFEEYNKHGDCNVIIADECQFFRCPARYQPAVFQAGKNLWYLR